MPPPLPTLTVPQLRAALAQSWLPDTAFGNVEQPGNPALGQCYPTARVVQWFFPRFEIASGRVRAGGVQEDHFWNIDPKQDPAEHLDLTWEQFGPGAKVVSFVILDRNRLNDSPPTIARCQRLLERVRRLAG